MVTKTPIYSNSNDGFLIRLKKCLEYLRISSASFEVRSTDVKVYALTPDKSPMF